MEYGEIINELNKLDLIWQSDLSVAHPCVLTYVIVPY